MEHDYEGSGQPMPRERGHALIQRYFKLKPEIGNKIEKFIRDRLNSSAIISVHYRGTDKVGDTNAFEAPRIKYEAVLEAIRSQIAQEKLQEYQIFVATDEEAFVELAEAAFPGRVVKADVERSRDGKPLHLGAKDPYKSGEEALIDCYLLANDRVRSLIRTSSNLSFFAKYLNPRMSVVEVSQRNKQPFFEEYLRKLQAEANAS